MAVASSYVPWSDVLAGAWPDDPRRKPERLAPMPLIDNMRREDKPLESFSAPPGLGPKTLLIDIEVAPSLVVAWDLKNPTIYPESILHPGRILCFSAKWLNSSKIFFCSEYHNGTEDMATQLWSLLDEAEVVMHYYGKKFDVPKINTLLLLHGLKPPSPFKQIDLWNTVSKKFYFDFNKLGHVTERLGLNGKAERIGTANWIKCMFHDPDAWDMMEKYNRQDVEALQELYDIVQAWVPSHPSHAAFTQDYVCPRCGSASLEKRGFAHTQVSRFQRYRCNTCGGWSRDTKSLSTVKIREVAEAG